MNALSHDPVGDFLRSAQESGLLTAADVATLTHELRESGACTKDDAATRLVPLHTRNVGQAPFRRAARRQPADY